jgi:phosphoserine phosphatase RsbU/P
MSGPANCRRLDPVTGSQVWISSVDERLQDMRALTEVALSHLEERDFLSELADRAKEILWADTAVVLLLDPPSGDLVAVAASGLDEEVQQGVRIPIGKGFAGRIAAERRPVIIDYVDHGTVLNPILLAKGVKSLLGVPLMANGSVVGVLHVGSLTHREFTDADARLLEVAANRAAQVTQAQHSATEALQRSLLPQALPAIPGLEMAARYVPGQGKVGGDWYDVFALPSGETCAVIGDVAGSGPQSAVIMGRLRTAVRSYALETRDPAAILKKLDRHVRFFEPDAIATVLCAVFRAGLEHVKISSAGHFDPVVAEPGRSPALAGVAADLLIGAFPSRRTVTTIGLPLGATLCLYTDGLVERRGERIEARVDRLLRTVSAAVPPRANCVAVMQALVGQETVHDDIAILMMRRAALKGRAGVTHAPHCCRQQR